MTTYDPATALAVVDVQNDFADPKGSLYVRGGEDVAPAANVEIEAAQAAGAFVVYTQDWHPPSTPHFAKDGGVWPVHCVRDTWGAEFHPDLVVVAGSPLVRKGVGGEDGYSGFTVADPATGDRSHTELAGILRDRGIERLIIAGLATDYCVKDTAIDGATLGFATVVLAGATRAVDLSPGDGDRAFDAMTKAHVVIG
jgi:nicotinamidase/pyrazinamidase